MGRAPLISALYQEDFAESVPMNCIRRTNTRAGRRIGMSGQSVVEIAFSLPFLLVIVLMVIEMGIVGDAGHAGRVGWGAAKGRFFGIVLKLFCGMLILLFSLFAAFPLHR